MHVPNKYKETNVNVLKTLIRSHPLSTWVTSTDGQLEVNHIPFLLCDSPGEYGVLKGHVSRANPVWKSLSGEGESIVVFQGAENYVTPSWYASKQEHGKVVPTWNYVVVHAHGVTRTVSDRTWLLEHLNALTDEQESKEAEPWAVADAPEAYIDQMLNGIVGIEITIRKLSGAWKTSQNKTQADQAGVVKGLNERSSSLNTDSSDSQSAQMASYVSQHIAK